MTALICPFAPLLSRLPSTSKLDSLPFREDPPLNESSTVNQPFNHTSPRVGFTESRLPSIDPASISLHTALHSFKPTSQDYYHLPYASAFNWSGLVLDIEVAREWYIVAFRSKRATGSVSIDLYQADRLAHEEAVQNGGLLAYWYGCPNDQGENLATCLWQSRAHALQAMRGAAHATAMQLASKMYSTYALERYVMRKLKGVTGVEILEWNGEEVKF